MPPSVTDEPSRSGTRSKPFVFFEGWDDLDWAQPGDHLIPADDGPVQVLTEQGWEEL